MDNTPNYGYNLPEYLEDADVVILNQNFTAIDKDILDVRQIAVLMYDPDEHYDTDALVGYENPTDHHIRMFRCLEDNVTGVWDSTKWTNTNVAAELLRRSGGGTEVEANPTGTATDYLTKVKIGNTIYAVTPADMTGATSQAAGAHGLVPAPSAGDEGKVLYGDGTWKTPQSAPSNLDDLGDVTLTTPTEGQILTYDGDEWVNTDAPDVDVTKTASGNPIEISDGANAPLVKCVTQITGYQEGSGTPSPDNIRPIVAYTEGKIEVRGKNICSPEYAITDRNGVTHVEHADGTVTLTGTVTGGDYYCYIKVGSNPINLTIGETYTFTIWKDGVKGTGQLFGYVRLDKGSTAGQRILLTNGSATVTIEEGTTLINFYMNAGTGAVATGTYSFQIEKGSVSTDYEPYTSTIHTIDLNGTRYGGTLDVVRGVLRVTHKSVVVNGDSTYTYQYNGAAGGYVLCFVNFGDKAYGLDNFNSDRFYKSQNLAPFTYQGRTNNAGIEFCFPIEIGTTSEDFKTWFASNNTQIVYELATPVEVDLTPTAIRSLLGYSHIESSTGEMEIEYITGKYQPIVDLISESSGGDSQHHYSTDEQVVGTWIDGSTVYEKTYVLQSSVATTANTWSTISGMSLSGAEDIIIKTEVYLSADKSAKTGLGKVDNGDFKYYDSIRLLIDVVTIQYTKSTDTINRSTKGGNEEKKEKVKEETKEELKEPSEPISEPLETKTDSLSKDEIELKEEDESKEIEEITEEPEVTEEEPTEEPVDPEPSKEEEADER